MARVNRQVSVREGKSVVNGVLLAAAVGLVALAVMRGVFAGVADAPPYLPVATDLNAMDLSSDRPVVAVVTADWCPPCQHLKRTSLADAQVERLLTDRAQSVMLDATDTNRVQRTLGMLGVRAFPSTVIIRGGEPVAMLEGYAGPEKFHAWLSSHLQPTPETKRTASAGRTDGAG